MARTLALLLLVLLALVSPAPGASPAPVLVLSGKLYPQYQQLASAFSREWQQLTGAPATALNFPREKSKQDQLLNRRPALIVGLGEAPTAWALKQQHDFPVAFTLVLAPERLRAFRETSPVKFRKLVGVAIEVSYDEQLKALVRLMPALKRIGVLTQTPELRADVKVLRAACGRRKIHLVHAELSSSSELPAKLGKLLSQTNLIWSLPDPRVYQPQFARYIIGQCVRRNIPLLGLSSAFVKAGATLSFERDYREIGKLLARRALLVVSDPNSSVDWVLESPERMVLSVNQRSFQALNLKIDLDIPKVSIVRH